MKKNKLPFLNIAHKLYYLIILIGVTSCVSPPSIKQWNNYSFERSENNPLIYPEMEGLGGRLGENINGPSVIKVPKWVKNPLGKYYMYFAHHHGKFIRLAYANSPEGPWNIYKPGALQIENTSAVGHIASPDVIIDEESKTIRMYFHGYNYNREGQKTFLSTSKDGLDFTALSSVLGRSYFRNFNYKGSHYALVSGTFYRSSDGIQPFEKGAQILPKIRHSAVTVVGDNLIVFNSQKGDAPERILKMIINLSEGTWKTWKPGIQEELLKSETTYEGVNLPIKESVNGFARTRLHELRDPAILVDKTGIYLYYSVAGESGIAVAKAIDNSKNK